MRMSGRAERSRELPPIDWTALGLATERDRTRRRKSFDSFVEQPERKFSGQYFRPYKPIAEQFPYIMHSGTQGARSRSITGPGPSSAQVLTENGQVLPMTVIKDAYERARYFEEQSNELREILEDVKGELAAQRHNVDCEHCSHVLDVLSTARSLPPARNPYYPFYVNQLGRDWRARSIQPGIVGPRIGPTVAAPTFQPNTIAPALPTWSAGDMRYNWWLDYDPIYGTVVVPPVPAAARYPHLVNSFSECRTCAARARESQSNAMPPLSNRMQLDDAERRALNGMDKLGTRYYNYRHPHPSD